MRRIEEASWTAWCTRIVSTLLRFSIQPFFPQVLWLTIEDKPGGLDVLDVEYHRIEQRPREDGVPRVISRIIHGALLQLGSTSHGTSIVQHGIIQLLRRLQRDVVRSSRVAMDAERCKE